MPLKEKRTGMVRFGEYPEKPLTCVRLAFFFLLSAATCCAGTDRQLYTGLP